MRPIVVFFDASFPGAIRQEVAEHTVNKLATNAHIRIVTAETLEQELQHAETRVFVNLHAPYFPKKAWNGIVGFLRRGGGLVSIGGAPFKIPVLRYEDKWKVEVEQTAYHQSLHIHETLGVRSSDVIQLVSNPDIPLFMSDESLFAIENTWNLVPHVTKNSDLPHESGSSGSMDTRVYPLVKGITQDNREVSAPVVLWEHISGPFAGGRWIFINQTLDQRFLDGYGELALSKWARWCSNGVTEMWLKPGYASYFAGERPMLTLQTQKIRSVIEKKKEKWKVSIEMYRDGEEVADWTYTTGVVVGLEQDYLTIPVDITVKEGLYKVICVLESESGEVRVLRQGFWGYDSQLLASNSKIFAGRDYFYQEDLPLPVIGMTYMASDVARKFLFLPNPQVWDSDMQKMQRSGINWIRTGIWTAYRNVMQIDGHASEEVLRSIDAFLLTASKYRMQVTFTFFSFTPEAWEGLNPYLDPRSIEAQKRFIRSIVLRHKGTTNVDWDLINEPSMFAPEHIFSNGPRSCRDPFEQAAFSKWLKKRHHTIEKLQELWNMTEEQLPSFEAAEIPGPDQINFDVEDMQQPKKGTRWLDYVLFSMDMHNEWARQMVGAIKENSPNQLVTVGQDEALGAQRPSPFWYGNEVDYTTVHSWWFNDHLVWDGVFSKTADKPNLTQETGMMYVETPNGKAKRSEEELRNILERKYAIAFATGGAGAIHWVWNTNFYMNDANESHIGALRADGTEKPESQVSRDFGHFMMSIRDMLVGRKVEDAAIVFPYSNDFSNRKLAFEATTKSVRTLAYEVKVPVRGVSEYDLDSLRITPAKIIIVPSPHNFSSTALNELLAIVRETGATLLWTGPINIDEYWLFGERMKGLIGSSAIANVCREELLILNGTKYQVSYGARKIAELSKEVIPNSTNGVIDVSLGEGRLLWSPLPLELSERGEAVRALYEYAVSEAGCLREMQWLCDEELPGVFGRKLQFEQGALYIFVSESSEDAEIKIKDEILKKEYSFHLESERCVLFAVDEQGEIRATYRPNSIRARTEIVI
ncbi:beta-galactosidase [Gorillibacterium massiliense]|uniref:beta-galactosidase n=1 Tax=Gorillibacterium massiliense TaxID=1280390 RepID=UPI0004AE5D39|nr:beta-galactosidase [Gorillibacterium massiliense]